MYMLEVNEVCPHCGKENTYKDIDVIACGYKAVCKECGKEIFLCSECTCANDFDDKGCDWHQENGCGCCRRGKENNYEK